MGVGRRTGDPCCGVKKNATAGSKAGPPLGTQLPATVLVHSGGKTVQCRTKGEERRGEER